MNRTGREGTLTPAWPCHCVRALVTRWSVEAGHSNCEETTMRRVPLVKPQVMQLEDRSLANSFLSPVAGAIGLGLLTNLVADPLFGTGSTNKHKHDLTSAPPAPHHSHERGANSGLPLGGRDGARGEHKHHSYAVPSTGSRS